MTRKPAKVVLLLGLFFPALHAPAQAQGDDRKGFEASFYTGASIDSFAADVAAKGLFRDSFLETGWGKSDIFRLHAGRRFKIHGYLSWDLGGEDSWLARHGMKPFIEITVDSDFGKGADSVRSYYGFNFDLGKLAQPD
jgi:hypothetical protein